MATAALPSTRSFGRANPGTKLIVSKHYTYEMTESAPLKMLDGWATNSADAVTAVSHYVGRDLLSHGTRAERMRVIWNGIDLRGSTGGRSSPLVLSAGSRTTC